VGTHVVTIKPGAVANLRDIDPGETHGLGKSAGEKKFEQIATGLGELQELLSAAGQQAVLVVLQGLDTSGKDGTITHVMGSVNPQGCRVESFKVPTPEEASHDFLWRAHRVTPPKGMMTIFNRSYYEDVLVARVHELVPEKVWRARYDQINQFESLLVGSGTIIVKFFLHISKDEQKKRLLSREDDPENAWKLSPGDWVERRSWEAYVQAYEEALSKCSTRDAPWHVVPADHKWYRNLAIAETLVRKLTPHRKGWTEHLEEVSKHALQSIKDARRSQRQPRQST